MLLLKRQKYGSAILQSATKKKLILNACTSVRTLLSKAGYHKHLIGWSSKPA